MRRLLVTMAVLLAGGLVAWVALRPGADGGPTAGGPRPADSPGPEDRPSPSGPPGSRAAAASLRGAPRTPAPEPGPSDVDATSAGPRLALVGEVAWVGAPRPGAYDVAVRSVGFGGMVWGAVEAEGEGEGPTFRLDISDVARGEPGTAQLEVEIDHPDAVQEKVRVDLPRGAGEDVHEIPVRVTLRPAMVLTGSVVDRDGHPVEAGVVAAFEMGPDGPVRGDTLPILPAAEAAVEKHQDVGRFRLRLLAEGRYLLIALAQPLRPAGREVTVRRGDPREIEPFVLLPGETIEGVVLRGGQAVPKASISAMAIVEDALPLEVEGTEVRWSPAGRLHVDGGAEVDEEGRFEIEGLEPGPHAVHAFLPDDVFGQVRAVLDRSGGDRVDAPARGLVIELVAAAAALELRVESEGRPLAGAGVQLGIQGGFTIGRTGEDGAWRYEVPPEQEVDVVVRADGFEPAHTVLRAGEVGSVVTHVFDLVPTAPGPEIVVRLTGPKAGDVASCWFAITPLGYTPVAPPVAGGPPTLAQPSVTQDRVEKPAERLGDGTGIYRLEGLLAGRTQLVTRPGASPWSATGYWLGDSRTIDLPDTGAYRVEVEVRLGGRLRIAARDEVGRLLDAHCEIRDDRGETQDVMFETHGESQSQSSATSLGTLSAATVDPPLPAGTYTVELSLEGRRTRTVEVEVKAGETTTVDVVL